MLSLADSPLLRQLQPVLAERWGRVSVVSDEPGVMEELASGGVSAVVVVEPDVWGHLRSLARAMGRHYGRVLCMKFEAEPGAAEARIAPLASRWLGAGALSAEQGLADTNEPAASARATAYDAREGAREEAAVVVAAPPPDAPSAGRVPEPLVTEEELAMLLGSAPGEVA